LETVVAPPPRPAVERLGPKPWGPTDALIAMAIAAVLFFGIGAIAVGAAVLVTGESDTDSAQIIAAGLVATIIFDACLVAIAYYFVARRYNLSWPALGFRPLEPDLWWVPPAAAIGLLVANGIYTYIMQSLGADALAPEQEYDDLFDTRALLPLAGLFTVLVAPFAEEIFVRGFLFPAFIGRLGVFGAALVSGLLFGAVHITSIDTIGLIIPIGAIGVVLALIYYRTGSLWATIATHLIINSIAFTFLATGAG
jgi:membrane protease YdiL (CAAX protease family)